VGGGGERGAKQGGRKRIGVRKSSPLGPESKNLEYMEGLLNICTRGKGKRENYDVYRILTLKKRFVGSKSISGLATATPKRGGKRTTTKKPPKTRKKSFHSFRIPKPTHKETKPRDGGDLQMGGPQLVRDPIISKKQKSPKIYQHLVAVVGGGAPSGAGEKKKSSMAWGGLGGLVSPVSNPWGETHRRMSFFHDSGIEKTISTRDSLSSSYTWGRSFIRI